MILAYTGLLNKLVVVSFFALCAWAYKAIQPPPPNIPGSLGGPPVTASRIKLRDERYLAYQEYGVPKDVAEYKVVYVHGYNSCRHDPIIPAQVGHIH